jgi:hypothetical protein
MYKKISSFKARSNSINTRSDALSWQFAQLMRSLGEKYLMSPCRTVCQIVQCSFLILSHQFSSPNE